MDKMITIDLHSHSLLSDGVLVPSELVRRYEVAGYSAVAITDHADAATLDWVIGRLVSFAKEYNQKSLCKVIPGVELTHIIPSQIAQIVRKSRKLGALLVLVHGETLVEPVAAGTNRQALLADIDILTHPGLICQEDVQLARRRGIFLELSGRKGHCLTNGHVARLACSIGAGLVYGTDFHEPGDLRTPSFVQNVLLGAGLHQKDVSNVYQNMHSLVKKLIK